jgi:hypothetical protein
MSRTTAVLFAGVALGVGLVYRSLFAGLSAGYDPDARAAVSRTAPRPRISLREEFAVPRPRTELLPSR